MAEIPKIIRRGKGKKSEDAEVIVDAEIVPPKGEAKDSPVIEAAYAGTETDAMKRAKELLARKRKQIIESTNSTMEG